MHPLAKQLHSFIIFRNLLSRSPLKELLKLLDTDEKDLASLNDAYAEFVCALYACDGELDRTLEKMLCDDENIYTRYLTTGEGDKELLERELGRELAVFNELSRFDGQAQRQALGDEKLPGWKTGTTDFTKFYPRWVRDISKHGLGIYAAYHMFVLDENGNVSPIRHPDGQKLSDLIGYEREREAIISNVEAFLSGRPANNMLLYGDAGTGKSSTVKAVGNAYADRGLRIVELKKAQLYRIPKLMDDLTSNPLKFIIFIDDLTFGPDDNDFCDLKAVLEGGVSDRGHNILICATSNHRHMMKETVSDRMGDEVNVSDRIQEIVSLSARFGLTVTFSRSDRDLYSRIVLEMAHRAGLSEDRDKLIAEAEKFALRGGGRNPRTARQFIDTMLATKQ